MSDFRLPTFSQRVAIMGRTGSGKTVLGAWLLSKAPFDRQPYVMIDYKGDELLNSIDRVVELSLNQIPKHPGLYIIHPQPNSDDERVENWLRRVWEKERIGLYVDEAYMLPDKGAFQGILTQGRSKRIPVITLTQRPKWISKFVFSESDYFSIFHLNDKDDRLQVKRFIHNETNLEERLEDYHSHWYDVGKNSYFKMLPAPKPEDIQSVIESRLVPKRRFL